MGNGEGRGQSMGAEGDVLDKTDLSETLPEVPDMSSVQALTVYSEEAVLALEKAAEYAPRVEAAMRKILVSIAYPGDWSQHGSTACLGSAGAERYLKHFPIRFSDWRREKCEWTDEIGPAYRWHYWATAEWNGRKILCEGRYSSREKFLGKVGGEYRPLTEIDEGDIQSAAQHICMGAGIKALLGLRGIKVEELVAMGVDKSKIADAGYAEGSKGGTTAADKGKVAEVRKMILDMHDKDAAAAKKYLVTISAFTAKDGKEVKGVQAVEKLTAGRLKVVHEKVSKEYQAWETVMADAAKSAEGAEGGEATGSEAPADEEPIKY